MNKPLGHILKDRLLKDLSCVLTQDTNLEDIKAGKFVAIAGNQYTFFSMITNLTFK